MSVGGFLDYKWRAKFYHLEEEDLGDIDFYHCCLARIPGPALVIPAGSGRLVPLAQQKSNLVFADIEPEMVKILRRRLELIGRNPLSGIQANIGEISSDHQYDAIIVPAESLQMFALPTLPKIFRSISAALTSGGLAIVDIATFSPACAGEPESPRYYRPDLYGEEPWEQWRRRFNDSAWLTRLVQHQDEVESVRFTFTYCMLGLASPTLKTTTIRLWRHSLDKILQVAREAGLIVLACHESYIARNSSNSRYLIEFLRK